MAEGVRRSFKKEFEECSKNLAMVSDVSEDSVNEILKQKQNEYPTYKNDKNIDKLTDDKSLNKLFKNAYKLACKRVEEETHQAMESVIFNLNSMHSRAGSQVPFSSLNFGLDTSEEGRLAMKQLLLAQEAGLGHGETSIFPITIFRLKKGISYDPGDPNYDLFKLAMRVSAKRLFPKQHWGLQ